MRRAFPEPRTLDPDKPLTPSRHSTRYSHGTDYCTYYIPARLSMSVRSDLGDGRESSANSVHAGAGDRNGPRRCLCCYWYVSDSRYSSYSR